LKCYDTVEPWRTLNSGKSIGENELQKLCGGPLTQDGVPGWKNLVRLSILRPVADVLTQGAGAEYTYQYDFLKELYQPSPVLPQRGWWTS